MQPKVLLALGVSIAVLISYRERKIVSSCILSRNLRNPEDEERRTTQTITTTSTTSLLHSIAPSFFPIDPNTGLIDLPAEIETIIIDVGARESDYLSLMENFNDPKIGLFLVDPLPDSIIPLQFRAAQYALKATPQRSKWLNNTWTNRVFAINAAVGETEGTADFNVAAGPACGSLLTANSNNTFWCSKSSKKLRVTVITLKDLLDLIPVRTTIKSMHLKVDAEGADLIALRGASEAIRRFSTVIIECHDIKDGTATPHEGDCIVEEAKEYMCQQHGFCDDLFELSGEDNMGNIIFRNTNNTSSSSNNNNTEMRLSPEAFPIPGFLTKNHQLAKQYQWAAARIEKK